jgi:DNA-binding CsgD family transcriptional regulator/tetratricopeptide (TPR) repeat protein
MELDALRGRARELLDRGATAEALATLEAGADEVSGTNPPAAARLLVEAASVALEVGGPERAVSIAERAVHVARDSGGIELQRAVIRLGDALSWAGRYEDARDAWVRASIEGPETDVAMLAERANALLRLGDPAAHDAAFRALVAARRVGDRDLVTDALNLVTVAEVRAGRLKEALGTAEQLFAEVAGTGTMDEVDSLGLLAWVLALLGDEVRCRAVMEQAGRGLADRRITAPGGLARGLLALSLGAAEEAAGALESKLAERQFGPVAAMTLLRPYGSELVEAYSRAGRLGDARRVLAACLPVALGSGQPRLIAPLRRAEGILDDDEDAFRHALDAHAGWNNRFEAGRTRLAFGEHLRRHRRRAEAREELGAAVAAFEHVGAVLWRERALAELRLAGERLPARRQPLQAMVEQLTRQEGEVLELVRAGLSNREIAERLVLSVKTVEGHLTTIYGKLGVASRAQALAALARSEPD